MGLITVFKIEQFWLFIFHRVHRVQVDSNPQGNYEHVENLSLGIQGFTISFSFLKIKQLLLGDTIISSKSVPR